MLAIIVYNVITALSFKDLLRRFGFIKNTRRDFYECGFKPQTQKPIKVRANTGQINCHPTPSQSCYI